MPLEKEKELLKDRFKQVLQNSAEMGGNSYLTPLRPIVDEVAEMGDAQIAGLIKRMNQVLLDKNTGLDAQQSEKFVQHLGEAHFYVVCKKHEIYLETLPVRNKPTADFRYKSANDVCFEVKTPSVHGGWRRINESINESFEGQIDLEEQLNKGEKIAITSQVIAPYGEIDHSKRLTCLIGVLRKKLKQNLKKRQFLNEPTYLVCNLMMLPIYGRSFLNVLRPVYSSEGCTKPMCPVSGPLWMVAFSKPGMLVFSEPEFEGKPGIEGEIEKTGLLVDNEHDYVSGIVFVLHTLDKEPCVVALVKSEEDLISPVRELVGTRWNDGSDSNGYALQS